jgi:hypothetical protein
MCYLLISPIYYRKPEHHSMDKIPVTPDFFIPMPVVLVGTQVTGKANFMTVG